MSTLSFSDSESTGDSRDTLENSQELEKEVQNLSHHDMWLQNVMAELDNYMQNAPENILTKWRGVKALTAVYYAGLKATQTDLEVESKKLFDATEALERAHQAMGQVHDKLKQAETERDALASLHQRLHDMVAAQVERMERWELVEASDEESE